MIQSICPDCKWEGNTTYCHWCKTSRKAMYPGYEPKPNRDQQRLDEFLTSKVK